jgi:hypothetical protein
VTIVRESDYVRPAGLPAVITDVDGRVWSWWKGALYRTPRPDLYPVNEWRDEVGQSAVPHHMINVHFDHDPMIQDRKDDHA